MADVHANIKAASVEVQEKIADAMETRAAEPRQREIFQDYIARVAFPENADVLEIGCGTGAITRQLAALPQLGHITGLDPSPVLLGRAGQLASGIDKISFIEGDCREIEARDASYDVVLAHTVLCHVPNAEHALAEAHRVLRPGGQLVIFDGDYATTTMALDDEDVLEAFVKIAMRQLVNDLYFVRRLPGLLRQAGFEIVDRASHGYVQADHPDYLLTLVDRPADIMAADGRIGGELAAGLKAEARRRVAEGRFYGAILFASFVARRPT